jgi:CheY-like chemotaxis protein
MANERGSERILVVEDNQQIQKVVCIFLDELGYRVSLAQNGDAALDVLAAEKNISLVLTDIVMPGSMYGVALVRRVRALYPHVAYY